MPETPDLLHDPEWTARVAGQVDLPRFDAIAARASTRTTQRRRLIGALAAVAVLVAGVGAWQLGGRDPAAEPAPVAPATSATATPTSGSPSQATEPSAAQVAVAQAQLAAFDDRTAQLAVDPDDSRVRAVLRRCHLNCRGVRGVLTLTADEFATQTLVPIIGFRPVEVQAVGDGAFSVSSGYRYDLYRPDSRTPIRVTRTDRVAPADGAEWIWGNQQDLWAVNPSSAVEHPVPLPSGASGPFLMSGNGRIAQPVREGTSDRIHTSDDGGATWQVGDLVGGDWRLDGLQPVPALPGARHWVVVVGDGSGGNINSVYDSTDAISWRRTEVPSAPIASRTAVRDDSLVISVDKSPGSDGGLFALVDGELVSWGDPVPGGVRHVLTLEPAGPVVVLSTDGTVWMSPDGTDWQRTRIRV